MSFGRFIAQILVPDALEELRNMRAGLVDERNALERERADFQLSVNRRVADVLIKMDPFEPFLRTYQVVFSDDRWEDKKPEDGLDSMEAMKLYMWAYATKRDSSFKLLVDWLRNQQGNKTLRKATNDKEWFYGRAAVAALTLFVEEIGRLSTKYEEILKGGDDSFDPHLATGEY